MSADGSPYAGLSHSQWLAKTHELIAAHPLKPEELVELVLTCWNDIFDSKLGRLGYRIGHEIKPKPQIMGFFLHEFLQLEIARRYPGVWRGEVTAADKDLVYIPDARYAIEIKTSSHPDKIFGNRSYAQKSKTAKKSKSGFYLAINFAKFTADRPSCDIAKIKFGWLDTEDWRGQAAQSGQQASLSPQVESRKLVTLYPPPDATRKVKKPSRTPRA
jgi:hypothetical protein